MSIEKELLYTMYFSILIWILARCSDSSKSATENAAGAKPNIVIILADDLGYGDLGSYNADSKIPTPQLDRLAGEGIRFTDAHSPSAVCTPTRYGLLTGRYSWRTRLKGGVFGGYNLPLIEDNRMTIASMLKEQGYTTAGIGKWHLGLEWSLKKGYSKEDQPEGPETIDFSGPIIRGPIDLGFDYFFGTSGNPTDDPPLVFLENRKVLGKPDKRYDYDWWPGENARYIGVEGWEHEKADTTYMNRAISFLERSVENNPDQPFFLYHALSAPHVPWYPPGFVKGKSDAGARGDLVVLADWVTGKIDSTLQALGVRENTLLIFTSDNGPREGENGHSSAGSFKGLKGQIWEGGHRVPFIARWPGKIERGTLSDKLIGLNDLFATLSATTGKILPDSVAEDSYNFLPALLGDKPDSTAQRALIHHSGAGVFAIRKGKWKLITHSTGGGYHEPPDPDSQGQLYDMEADPYETTNLFSTESAIVKELSRLLNQYKKQGNSRMHRGRIER